MCLPRSKFLASSFPEANRNARKKYSTFIVFRNMIPTETASEAVYLYSAGSQIRPGRGSVFSLVLPASRLGGGVR
jgi:hypothetical protein